MDGSSRRAALLTPFHRIEGSENSVDISSLEAYVSHDDGYEECIPLPSSSNFDPHNVISHRCKQIKFDLLKILANRSSNWVASIPPSMYLQKYIAHRMYDDENEQIRWDEGLFELLSTARVLGLTHYDYNGRATEILEVLLKTAQAGGSVDASSMMQLFEQDNTVDYRAWTWIERLAKETRRQLNEEEPIQDIIDDLSTRRRDDKPLDDDFDKYVKLGEIDVLYKLEKIAQTQKIKLLEKGNLKQGDSYDIYIREEPCSKD
jgi:hypothetical protein